MADGPVCNYEPLAASVERAFEHMAAAVAVLESYEETPQLLAGIKVTESFARVSEIASLMQTVCEGDDSYPLSAHDVAPQK